MSESRGTWAPRGLRAIEGRLRLVARGTSAPKPRRTPDRVLEGARQELETIVAGNSPVIAGPWLGEVGYELLYWIPFLRWLTREDPGLRERLVVLSRGGVESWYSDIASSYAEIFELASFDELESWRAEPQIVGEDETEPDVPALAPRKARRVTQGDRTLVERAAKRLSLADYALLHPSVYFKLMYRLRDLGAWSQVDRVSAFARIEAPEVDFGLPDSYIAVRFYSSAALPASPESREVVDDVLRGLARRLPLVDLDPRFGRDDHAPLTAAQADIRLGDRGIPVARNLAVQTAVVARAAAFVGTYGGLAYLPPLLGVPSLALYTEPTFFHQHLERAERLFRGDDWGAFAAVDVGSGDIRTLLRHSLGT